MWLVNTRPDISCATSMASRTIFELFKEDPSRFIKELNKDNKHVKSIDLPLRFPKLDINTLKLVVYTDSSFCNSEDMSSQLGYMNSISDSTGKCQHLHSSSNKSKRVTMKSWRSLMGLT
jgi:hypothetical protein